MRILFVIPAIGPVYGGTSKIVIELTQALGRRAGVALDIVTTDLNGAERLPVAVNEWISENGRRIRYFPHPPDAKYVFNWKMLQWLRENVSSYDIVHVNTLFSPLASAASAVAVLRRTPYVATPHGMLETWAFAYKSWKKKPYFALLEKPLLQRAHGVHTNTGIESERVRALGVTAPTYVVPNGVDPDEYDPLPTAEIFLARFPHLRDKRLILFLSRIDPKKGLDLLIPAFARIVKIFPDAHLVIAGPDNVNYKVEVEQSLRAHACADAATFPGMLGGELKRAALAAAAIYILPSYSEGMSMSVLEAMAAGLPCIFTTGCCFPEAGEADAARIVAPRMEEIASALETFLGDPNAAIRTGETAKRFIRNHYTWDHAAEKLHRAYLDILDRRRSSAARASV
jgi:glycosyltransferase involved in cell wall biosynthesis